MSVPNKVENARLYLVLDRQVTSYDRLFDIITESVAAGVDIIQIRDKNGSCRDLLDFSRKARDIIGGKVPFIVNDRLDLALAAEADGVHLGQDDLPLKEARKIAGRDLIIGTSCQTLDQALKAQDDGADYIGFGSIYRTLTKPDRSEMDFSLIREILTHIKIPVFFIGGITLENLEPLCELGVKRIAVTRALCLAQDIEAKVKDFVKILDNS